MQRVLIHPPFADPTQPYLAAPTLKGHLRARGLDARVVDLNVEAAHHLFSRPFLDELATRLGQRFLKLNRARVLEFEEQLEYKVLAEARSAMEIALGADPPPLCVFQDPELFFDPAAYALARRRTEALFEALSAAHFPYRYEFNRASRGILPWSFEALETYCGEELSPLDGFYRQIFDSPEDWSDAAAAARWIDLEALDFIGISIVFPSQIPEALYLARFLKRRAPGVFIALGGPCIHQAAIYMDDARRRRLLGFADAVGLYEGEETLAALFERLDDLRRAPPAARRAQLLAEVPNLLHLDEAADAVRIGPQSVVDLRQAAAPDYGDLDLDRYLAPGRILLYAPTRGCYWNQCSFCYYGLSDTATARYREVPPERAAADLARLSQRHGARNFYISCDVLSPSYAVRFAQALLDRGLKLRWSSDLKIDAFFTKERCELLFRSGLRAAAFGIESGSDRILELMRKGCDRETMTAVNRSFHGAGVATEWMAFTDHPGESAEEALETVRWIGAERDFVDLFIVGEFGLQPGSHVAQEPARYGVETIEFAEGDDFRLYATFTERRPPLGAEERRAIDGEIETLAAPYALSHYPWAGAISTHHSFLHLLRFGQRAFLTHFQRAGAEYEGALPPPPPSHVPGLREWERFSLKAIEAMERRFEEEFRRRSAPERVSGRRGEEEQPLPALSDSAYRAAGAAVRPLKPGR
jgi:hypothetical protein